MRKKINIELVKMVLGGCTSQFWGLILFLILDDWPEGWAGSDTLPENSAQHCHCSKHESKHTLELGTANKSKTPFTQTLCT